MARRYEQPTGAPIPNPWPSNVHLQITHPSYLLNPGDMFQVDPEKVMTATGRQRPSEVKKYVAQHKSAKAAAEGEDAVAAEAETVEETVEEVAAEAEDEPLGEESAKAANVKAMKDFRDRVKGMIKAHKSDLSGNRKKALRTFMKEARASIAKGQKSATSLQETKDIVNQLADSLAKLSVSGGQTGDQGKQEGGGQAPEIKLSKRDLELIKQEKTDVENPYDPTKPYLTPWRPRPYMAPFAFIPRYLEVNQKICAAVYLRHPVARKAEAEVPTPFGTFINQLAFGWYLRRG
jgi:ribosomal protein S4